MTKQDKKAKTSILPSLLHDQMFSSPLTPSFLCFSPSISLSFRLDPQRHLGSCIHTYCNSTRNTIHLPSISTLTFFKYHTIPHTSLNRASHRINMHHPRNHKTGMRTWFQLWCFHLHTLFTRHNTKRTKPFAVTQMTMSRARKNKTDSRAQSEANLAIREWYIDIDSSTCLYYVVLESCIALNLNFKWLVLIHNSLPTRANKLATLLRRRWRRRRRVVVIIEYIHTRTCFDRLPQTILPLT